MSALEQLLVAVVDGIRHERPAAASRFRTTDPARRLGATVVAGAVGGAVATGAFGALAAELRLERWQYESAPWEQIDLMVIGAAAAVLFVGWLLFGWWFARAYRNVGSWHVTAHRPSYAYGCWFVPLFNVVRPAQMMRELLGNSDDRDRGATFLAPVWWAAFVGGAGSLSFGIEEVGAGLLAVSALLLLALVWRVSLLQRRRIERASERLPAQSHM